ncbi:mitoferrin-2-like protein [Lates japonicus]|uniref:Mitoferrin-2-like protein n=1 Tax=Lates japonicus TaxID=270547 RepID=A0AAD3RNJ0_LATJO|nr:mitoferrin-2-like protein [Lates japonicus]
MEADGFVKPANVCETPGVDSRRVRRRSEAEFRWLGGRLLDTTEEFNGSLSSRRQGTGFLPRCCIEYPGDPDLCRARSDYEGLPWECHQHTCWQ